MVIRSFVVALALLASLGCALPARAQTMVQRIDGTRFEELANAVARGVRLTGDAKLIPQMRVPDQILPAGPVRLIVGSALVSPVYVNVPIEVDVNGKFLRNVYVGYRVQRYIRTAVAAHDLVPGTVLAASDLEMARVPYMGQEHNGTNVLIGRKVVIAVRKGAQILIESTQTNQIVRAGSVVVLIVDDGGVSVVASVVARSSGGLGDVVSVYNPQTNKLLSGTVVGPERVELDISGEVQ
jgi:flagella basal body P-ring formation protein FlgA